MALDFDVKGRKDLDLTGKVVVVVGGGQMPGEGMGNGRAGCIVYARHGAEVVAVAKHLDRAQATVDIITSEGGRAYAIETDVAERENCKKIFDTVMAKSGKVNGMVYNVAMNPKFDSVNNTVETEDFNYGIDVNLLGANYCNIFAAECMEKNEDGGSIVNISSIASIQTRTGMNMGLAAYAFGKAGLNHMTRLAAVQYAPKGIRVNTLVLGPINSVLSNTDSKKLFQFDDKQVKEKYSEFVKLKMGRASVWESAYAVLYLLADESRFMTGQEIMFDGGATVTR